MRLITIRSVILTVAARWRAQYPTPEDRAGRVATKEHRAVGERLDALDLSTVTAKEVDAIIGNDSWTALPACSECERTDLERVLHVGDEPDYESHHACLCEECAVHAVEAFITGKDRPKPEEAP